MTRKKPRSEPAMQYALDNRRLQTKNDQYWIAPTAAVMGDVRLGSDVGIWWHAVLRGDNEPITIGDRTNIQDGSVLHNDPGFPLDIGANVTVGHMAMLHGCRIGQGSLIGIGAVILNGAEIGEECLIGAKALIPEGKVIPPRSLVMGIPGKIVGEVTDVHIERIERGTQVYVDRWRHYAKELRQLD